MRLHIITARLSGKHVRAGSLCDSIGSQLEGYEPASDLHAAGLFDLENDQVLAGYKLFERLYPASTTKVMTAYVALKYGNLDDVVTVSEHATDFNWTK